MLFQGIHKFVSKRIGPSAQQQGCTPGSTKTLLTTVHFTHFTFLIKNTKKTKRNLTTDVQQMHETQRSMKYFQGFKLILNHRQKSDLLDWLQKIHFWHCLLCKQPYITCDSFCLHSCESHKVFLESIFFPAKCSFTEGSWIQAANRKVLHKSTKNLKTQNPLTKVVPKLNFKLGKI